MKKFKNIAVISPDITNPYTYKLWLNFIKISKQYNYNFYYFVGSQLEDKNLERKNWNFVYEFLNSEKFDGIIVFSGSLFHYVSTEKAIEFYKKIKNIPIVNISLDIGGYPVILTDNKSGIKETVKHFVCFHNRKNIVFITGPLQHPEAIERLNAFKEGLIENGLKINEDYIIEGDFHAEKAIDSMKKFLSKNLPFDAIIASNDMSALAVMNYLQKKGFNIPEDIIMSGYDDSIESLSSIPSLSSVHQPIEKMAQKAIEIMTAIFEKKHYENKTVLNTYFIPRESCGCISEKTNYFIFKTLFKGDSYSSGIEFYNSECDNIISLMLKTIRNEGFEKDFAFDSTISLIENIFFLIDSFSASKMKNFVKTLSEFLIKTNYDENKLKFLQKVFEELRHLILIRITLNETLVNNIDKIFKDINDIIFAYTINHFNKIIIEKRHFNEKLDLLIQRILASHNDKELKQSIEEILPKLNKGLFTLNLFEENVDISKAIVAIPDKRQIEDEEIIFNTKNLIPEELEDEKPHNFLILPLVVRNSKFGFIVIEVDSLDPIFYFSLREQISISISNKLLLYEVIERNFHYQKELEMARKVQLQLLPTSTPSDKISFFYQPIANVGGDFFYFIENKEKNELTIFICDVAGHGMPAAIITSMIKSFILQYKKENFSDPAQFLLYLNNNLAEEAFDQYVTAFMGTFKYDTREFIYCSAAHPMPFIVKKDKITQIENKNVKSFALGIYCNSSCNCFYNNYSINISPDTRIIFYTDGLMDWVYNNDYDRTNEEMQLDKDKFFDFLLENFELSPKDFLKKLELKINNDLKQKNSKHKDDICIICFDV
ncbi:MAG: SpoIIE family protein phosphatase [Brevinematales bacterium]